MDQERFVATFRIHLGDVSRYLVRRIDPNQVEDLASEVFEIAWRKRKECPEGMELPWLYRIASFVLANHRKKLSNRFLSLPLMETDAVAPSAEDVSLMGSDIGEAYQKLSSVDKQIIALLVFDELSVAEIAVVLSISVNTTSQRLKRARERLARNLASQMSDIDQMGH